MTISNLQPVYIVGPTASGKSELALSLAKRTECVIISADSMQIYRGLDIGTAKVSASARREVEHKLIDIRDADEEFSVAEFAELAAKEISDAQKAGKLPVVVGGTGLYFDALIYPMSFANTVKDPKLRAQLNAMLEERGNLYMHAYLEKLDPQSAKRLHPNDVKRVIRALEIVLSTGKTLKECKDDRKRPSEDLIMVGLRADRKLLYERIDRRVDKMFEDGLVNEALSVGSFDYQSMQAIGYKEFKDCKYVVENGVYRVTEGLEDIKDKIKQHTRNYAKRQLTWFRKYDFIKWFDISERDEALGYILDRSAELPICKADGNFLWTAKKREN